MENEEETIDLLNTKKNVMQQRHANITSAKLSLDAAVNSFEEAFDKLDDRTQQEEQASQETYLDNAWDLITTAEALLGKLAEKEIEVSTTFPRDETLSMEQLCAPIVCMLAAFYGAPIPITWADIGDVCVYIWKNTAGWLANEYCLGNDFLKTAEASSRGEQSTSAAEAPTVPPSGSVNDTQQDGSVQASSSRLDFWSVRLKGSSHSAQQFPGLADISPRERAVVELVKRLHSRTQLMSSGVALSYLLTRLVAKLVQHAINHGANFSVSFAKYSLDIDPNTTLDLVYPCIYYSVPSYRSCLLQTVDEAKNLTGSASREVRSSDQVFNGLSDMTIEMLGDMGDRVIDGIRGGDTVAIVKSLDSGPACYVK
ncbi:unnamed protein product [Strongylus vulgaris]|uniref:Uncharacterized protein n=1 Tax=Strongylus vulgaris TaxID=40348 RepID=A0A3P7LSE5_STRVU|nr:unnamed protein product [Strongylus vulgaris]